MPPLMFLAGMPDHLCQKGGKKRGRWFIKKRAANKVAH